MKIYFDTAVLVAASVADHPHYAESEATLRVVRARKIEGHVSAHGLAEFYSVLTRTPFTPPIYPNEAWQLVADNILPYFQVVPLSAQDYQDTIRSCAQRGWSGGRVYDALHIGCAKKASCARIYTLNVRHFQQLAPELKDQISAPFPI